MNARMRPARRAAATLLIAFACAPASYSQAPVEQKPEPPKSAEEKPREAPQQIWRVIQLKHADPNELHNMLHLFPVRLQPNRHMKTLTVQGSREMVSAIEETVKRFDVPPAAKAPEPTIRNVDLTVHLLVGREQGPSEPMPAILQPVVTQLTALFPYKSYRLAETLALRGRDGKQGYVSGVIRLAPDSPRSGYRFSFAKASVRDLEKERQIRLDNLELVVDVPLPKDAITGKETSEAFNNRAVAVRTDVDLREGQKVVVGKATLDGEGQALILVVTGKIVD